MKHLEAKDERGRIWIAFDGDSGWRHCQALSKLGVRDIILPAEVFLYGTLSDDVQLPDLNGFTPDVLINDEVKQAVGQLVRLGDCIQWCRNNKELVS